MSSPTLIARAAPVTMPLPLPLPLAAAAASASESALLPRVTILADRDECYLRHKLSSDAEFRSASGSADTALIQSAIDEYVRFMQMIGVQEQIKRQSAPSSPSSRLSPLVPSRLVDSVWHWHILHTRVYASMCQRAFDRFIHHVPSESEPEPQERAANTNMYQITLNTYVNTFKQQPPTNIWGAMRCNNNSENGTCSSCQSGSCKHGVDSAGTCSSCKHNVSVNVDAAGTCSASCQAGQCKHNTAGTCSANCQAGQCKHGVNEAGTCSASCQAGQCKHGASEGTCSANCQAGQCKHQ